MIDPDGVPPVEATESVARFVLFSGHFRADKTVKPNAFIPSPHTELSVTRHLMASESELWDAGKRVAFQRSKTLYGRADVGVDICRGQRLAVDADPTPDNPNHALVSGWPADKEKQMLIAAEIAAAAAFLSCPDRDR